MRGRGGLALSAPLACARDGAEEVFPTLSASLCRTLPHRTDVVLFPFVKAQFRCYSNHKATTMCRNDPICGSE